MTPTQRTIRFEIAHALPLQNTWQRWHWRKRGRYLRTLSVLLKFAGTIPPEPLAAVSIAVVRRSKWRGIEPDRDAVCIKPLLDVLQPPSRRHPYGLGVIADDSRSVVLELSVDVEKGAAATILEIEDLSHE